MNISQEAYNNGINLYESNRTEDDFDLISEVRNILSSTGISVEKYNNNNMINLAKDKKTEVQRHYLNRYWSSQLANVSCSDTLTARCSLVPNGPIDNWINLFKENVLPICQKYNLPR